ncbi:general stress protein [Virgibacillus soli]|uniref:General stress protein n=1 Tax=Paracerasibacillus soli TaxID=480284 RepID=A0ABU5CNS6_9BACI|nr:general stress protein [Virgibacillus soli]MDY0407502.1 general stress protein [Virgibacillus soli]
MKPFIKEYANDEQLQKDVEKLANHGVLKEDIYILAHDNDRTNRLIENTGANKIGYQEMEFGEAVQAVFRKKGDELRTKMTEMGLSQTEAEIYEEDLDTGKVLLMVTNQKDLAEIYL